MPLKAFRDPIHNHIYFDKDRDKLILELLSCPEVQRLRRIRQLGVSSSTYPGAEHSRFGHALGTCHLMAEALRSAHSNQSGVRIPERMRLAALAAALLHDVGHAPFSHLLEKELLPGMSHERCTSEILRSSKSAVHQVLRAGDPTLPETVIELIEARPKGEFSWVSCLLHSQIDVDRMDYLLRDSYFCGVQYGQYDIARILHTMRIRNVPPLRVKQPVWLEKGASAVEEYIFARYYMYCNVYYHRTTRGYEELLRAILRRANSQQNIGDCPEVLARVLLGEKLGIAELLALDDSVICAQILRWRNGATRDKILRDLSRRFLDREGLKPLELKRSGLRLRDALDKARAVVKASGFDPDFYFLTNEAIASAYDSYHPEEETRESSAGTSILIETEEAAGLSPAFREISRISPRLKAITDTREVREYCYVPEQCRPRVASAVAAK